MVISFPAAAAAPQPLGALLDRCAACLAEAPASPGNAQLLKQLRDVRPGMLMLPAPDTATTRFVDGTDATITRHSRTAEVAFFTYRHDGNSKGRYRWAAQRFDDTGRMWRTAGLAVVDDFGNLVEVLV